MSLFNRRRPLLRVAARASLLHLSRRDDLTHVQREAITTILENRNGEFDSLVELMDADLPPAGSRAMRADIAGGSHPFLDWLSNGGAAWMYSVAVIVLAMFGVKLPPLPPLPPMPTLSESVAQH